MITSSRQLLVSAAPPREPPWTLGPILFPIILCARARVVCGLHKWDPSLILPTVARDSSCVSPQALLKGSAVCEPGQQERGVPGGSGRGRGGKQGRWAAVRASPQPRGTWAVNLRLVGPARSLWPGRPCIYVKE